MKKKIKTIDREVNNLLSPNGRVWLSISNQQINKDMDTSTTSKTNRKRANSLEVPSSSKQSRSTENVSVSTPYNVSTGNSYELLNQETHEPPENPPPLPPTKKVRVPTITTKWPLNLVSGELLRADIKPHQYTIKLTAIGTVVKLTNIIDYNKFESHCTVRKVPHFTHALDDQKPVRIVLRGLPDTPTDEIISALNKKDIQPFDIKKLSIKNIRYDDHSNYLLYFHKCSVTIQQLRNVKSIFSVIIHWNYYDSKRHGPTQCRRCQIWGHGSSNCHLQPAFVKCAGAHETGKCSR